MDLFDRWNLPQLPVLVIMSKDNNPSLGMRDYDEHRFQELQLVMGICVPVFGRLLTARLIPEISVDTLRSILSRRTRCKCTRALAAVCSPRKAIFSLNGVQRCASGVG